MLNSLASVLLNLHLTKKYLRLQLELKCDGHTNGETKCSNNNRANNSADNLANGVTAAATNKDADNYTNNDDTVCLRIKSICKRLDNRRIVSCAFHKRVMWPNEKS